jgi:hypothetical protein
MTRISVHYKLNQDYNEWLQLNGIPPLAGVSKISYQMATGNLYGLIKGSDNLFDDDKWFWFCDSDKVWKRTTHGPV